MLFPGQGLDSIVRKLRRRLASVFAYFVRRFPLQQIAVSGLLLRALDGTFV